MTPNLPQGPLAEITECLYRGQKIQAIKLYREATGAQLVDAKNAVEKFEAELRAAAPEKFTAPARGKGCSVAVTTSALLLALLAAFALLARH
jgi:hypothetical protein